MKSIEIHVGEYMYVDRVSLYQEMETLRDSKVILYVTGDRQGVENHIRKDAIPYFVDQLDPLVFVPRISLILHTLGGDVMAGWSIVHLLRQYCDYLEIIVPFKAFSAGTLMCLGADKIIMTKQANLGPIDPSLTSPLGPELPGAPEGNRAPVSVEAINGFIELAKDMGVAGENNQMQVLQLLSSEVHPLVLGQVFRVRAQIRMLGRRLLEIHGNDKEKTEKILKFLCSESGSHDYAIHRQEARDQLGLKVDRPDDDLYRVTKAIYDDFAREMELATPLNLQAMIVGSQARTPYSFMSSLNESAHAGSYRYVTEGEMVQGQNQAGQYFVQNIAKFEGWKYEQPPPNP